jgi:hypothetical protein
MQIDINTDAAIVFSDILERIGKSALPNAVRETLSKTALDVKQKTMPQTAETLFTNRRKNFFKANSVVDFAKGKDINSMRSAVGFNSQKLKGGNNFAVKDLEQQEYGGDIDGKSFIPLDNARIGKSYKKSVRANARISGFKNLPNVSNAKGANWKQRAIKTAVFTGVGKYMLATSGRVGSIYKITSIRRDNGNTVFKKIKMYSYDKNRNVKVRATGFMEKSADISQKKMNDIYAVESKKQIDRYLGILMK